MQTTLVVVQKFNFEQMLDSIQRYRITHLWSVLSSSRPSSTPMLISTFAASFRP